MCTPHVTRNQSCVMWCDVKSITFLHDNNYTAYFSIATKENILDFQAAAH